MKRFMLALFLIAAALASTIAMNPSHASGTITVSIDSSTQQFPSANVGDTIKVNITISNVQGLWAWDISDLTFNPAFLQITGVNEGPFLQKAGQTLFIWTSDSTLAFSKGDIPDMSDTLLEYTSASGSGVLATLTFKVLSLGTSQIAFNQTTLLSSTNLGTVYNPNYRQIACTTINSNISVGGDASNPTSAPTTTSSTSPSPTASASTTDSSPTPNSQQAPEFPVFSILIILIIAATISTLLLTKKAKLNKK
jgi:hypothetical protein